MSRKAAIPLCRDDGDTPYRKSPALEHANLRVGQVLVNAPAAREQPPVVEKNLDWTPHRDPTADGQALMADGEDRAAREFADGNRGEQAQREEGHADHEADAPLKQTLAQFAVRQFGLVIANSRSRTSMRCMGGELIHAAPRRRTPVHRLQVARSRLSALL